MNFLECLSGGISWDYSENTGLGFWGEAGFGESSLIGELRDFGLGYIILLAERIETADQG